MNQDYLNNPMDPDSNDAEQEPTSMSLLGGIAGDDSGSGAEADEFVIGSSKPASKLLSQGTLLIVAVAAIAGGTLYAMRVTSGDISADTVDAVVEARIEQALTKLSKPEAMADDDPLREQNIQTLFQDTETIVDMFATDPTNRQVPLEQVKKDPFEIAIRKPSPEVDNSANDRIAARKAAEERELLVRKIKREADELELQTIMRSRVPVAVISGEVVRAGQSVNGFTVKSIDELSVNLESQGLRFKLTLEGIELIED